MTIGNRIKNLRIEANMLQSELAITVGCSSQVISNIERGYTKPSSELVNKCAAYFAVPADYILGRTSSKYSTADLENTSIISTRIKDRMAQLQLIQSDLINESGLTEESFADILSGNVIPSIDIAARLSKALGTSMDYLIGSSEYSCTIVSEDEQDIIMLYRHLSKKGKRIFLGMMESMEEKTE